MRTLCPTCNGKGSINDPQYLGVPMMYCGKNGETCPQTTCQTCNGEGWIGRRLGVHFPPDEEIVAGGKPIRKFIIGERSLS